MSDDAIFRLILTMYVGWHFGLIRVTEKNAKKIPLINRGVFNGRHYRSN